MINKVVIEAYDIAVLDVEDMTYESTFNPSAQALELLQKGKIATKDESPADVITRVVSAISLIEVRFETGESDLKRYAAELGKLLDSGQIVLSTSILANAGRAENRPLSGCAMPPIKKDTPIQETKQIIYEYHIDGMGTGFNLDEFQDPAQRLRELNCLAILCTQSGLEDRPVGNMAVCSIDHPKIKEFIQSKINAELNHEEWRFNISLGVTDRFMDCAKANTEFTYKSANIDACKVLKEAASAAYKCSDPGIIFVDKIRKSNPDKSIGTHLTVDPCGEVSLAYGETCHFGYLNLGKFIKTKGSCKEIDYMELAKAVTILVRSLDNAVEISLQIYSRPETVRATSERRKIGVGVCGFADLLFELNIPYDSKKASTIAADLMSFINYHSKIASHELAKQRGTINAMNKTTCKYSNPGFLSRKFGKPTTKVKSWNWIKLAKIISSTRYLRNIATTAIPPTGRSAMIYDASTGIEPMFSLYSYRKIHPALHSTLTELGLDNKSLLDQVKKTGSIQGIPEVPKELKAVFKTALEILPRRHIDICAAFQEFIDEGVSKTVNLPAICTADDVLDVFFYAYQRGLKGITIYRDGSRTNQPIVLGKDIKRPYHYTD